MIAWQRWKADDRTTARLTDSMPNAGLSFRTAPTRPNNIAGVVDFSAQVDAAVVSQGELNDDLVVAGTIVVIDAPWFQDGWENEQGRMPQRQWALEKVRGEECRHRVQL
jgi:hypothetical protein